MDKTLFKYLVSNIKILKVTKELSHIFKACKLLVNALLIMLCSKENPNDLCMDVGMFCAMWEVPCAISGRH